MLTIIATFADRAKVRSKALRPSCKLGLPTVAPFVVISAVGKKVKPALTSCSQWVHEYLKTWFTMFRART